jgi:hypothetical protein
MIELTDVLVGEQKNSGEASIPFAQTGYLAGTVVSTLV